MRTSRSKSGQTNYSSPCSRAVEPVGKRVGAPHKANGSHLIRWGLCWSAVATLRMPAPLSPIRCRKLFPKAHSGALYLFKSSRNFVEAESPVGHDRYFGVASLFPMHVGLLPRGQPHWSEHPGSGISCQHLTQNSTTECLCVPMIAQGNTVGVLHLEFNNATVARRDSGVGNIRDSWQQLATSAASQIALSLASLQLRETLREQSIRDPLTRLFNRRFLEDALERELQIAIRKVTDGCCSLPRHRPLQGIQ